MRRILLALTVILFIMQANADESTYVSQRQEFIAAKQALIYHNTPMFILLSSQLKNYPLYPYLIYADLSTHLDEVSPVEISNFLSANQDPLLSDKLRNEWLLYLANKKQWNWFLKFYSPSSNVQVTCDYMQALSTTGQQNIVLNYIPKLWLTGNTLPENCESAFVDSEKMGIITPKLVWARFELALRLSNDELLKKLLILMPEDQKNLALLMVKLHRSPGLVTQTNLFMPLTLATQQIAIQAIEQLAQIDPQKTSQIWPQLQREFHFSVAQQQAGIQAIAIELARNNDPNAAAWLSSIQPAYINSVGRQWRVRVALSQLNWPQVDYWIQRLSPTERNENCWQYWYARALAAQGHIQSAKNIYLQLASQVDYYGLLASQQLGQSYQPKQDQTLPTNQELEALENIPAIQRAHELYVLNMIIDARREWDFALTSMDSKQLKAAAQLASNWNWYDRAIITIAKAHDLDNVKLRFPLAYPQQIIEVGKQLEINPAWIYAIMHQESSFMFDAKSNVGAVGLMQLMPQTAKVLAAISLTNFELLNTSTNIELGSRYLKELLGWYRGNEIAASAAYNIGPSRLNKWLSLQKSIPSDVWVELLPWKETRDYVKAVVLGTALYQQELK